MSEMNFRDEVKLDKHNLDECALEQPELFAKWGKAWADAIDRRDRLKDKLGVVRSECDNIIRQNPAKYGWDNPLKVVTEAFINSAIAGHPDMIAANEEYLDASHEVNLTQVAKEAFDHRRRSIDALINLHNSGYFSGNKDFDKGYQKTVDKVVHQTHSDGLEKNPRLARRRAENANP